MKMMKKWLSLLLCGVLLLSTGGLFAACGKQTDDGQEPGDPALSEL